MPTRRPIGYDEQLREHRRLLEEDPEYLEEFLLQTEIPNESDFIEFKIRDIYTMNDAQSVLPAKDELVDLINRAHADAQAYERNLVYEHGWGAGHLQDAPIGTNNSYFLLRNLPVEYYQQVQEFGIGKISYEEALHFIKEIGRSPQYEAILTTGAMHLTFAETGKDLLKGLVSIPLALAGATVGMVLPDSVRAKIYMKNVNKEADNHFQDFKEEIDKVLELYAEI